MNARPRKYTKSETRIDLLRDTIVRLRTAGIPDPAESTEWLAMEAFRCSRAELWSNPSVIIDASRRERFEEMVSRRLAREPVQYLVGYTEFFGLRFSVDHRVLIPRPETEMLVEMAISMLGRTEEPAILDIGTGSGCIAVTLALRVPGSRVTACDISQSALEVAADNARSLQAEVRFVCSDVREPEFGADLGDKFDLIISNPPYIPLSERSSVMPEVGQFEPEIALFVPDDATSFYRVISDRALTLLKEDGRLALEVHSDYGQAVATILRQAGFCDVLIEKDLAGKPRILTARR